MPEKKRIFNVGPSAEAKGKAVSRDDKKIKKQQSNWSPIKKMGADAVEGTANFFSGLMSDPTGERSQFEKDTTGIGGKLGALLGNAPDGVGPGLAVAFGGGKGLPRLRAEARMMLENLDLKQLPEWMPDWITYMQQKYPRVMAHNQNIRPTTALDNDLQAVGVNSDIGMGFNGKPIPKLSSLRFDKSRADTDTAFHELEHSRQRLTTPDFSGRYSQMHQDVGYDLNPFEVDARLAGDKNSRKFDAWRNEYNPPFMKLKPELSEIDIPKNKIYSSFDPLTIMGNYNKNDTSIKLNSIMHQVEQQSEIAPHTTFFKSNRANKPPIIDPVKK